MKIKTTPTYRKICPTCKDTFLTGDQEKIYCSVVCEDYKDDNFAIVPGRKRSFPCGFLKLRFSILQRDGFRCQYCGSTIEDGVKLEVDHIIPYSKGGLNNPGNLITACKNCNIGKFDRKLTKKARNSRPRLNVE